MRLTKLKLAGFKSFVDPTTIALPGQLIGVVGPNGCGKSNVMDAVRWVLGESKASELRGESMQDVIFNGSGSRKAVSRAAVELIFDNTLGRITGQWSQYAELSVKRVLTRNGQSEYYINNQHVRRKDITDLFLGTGLGPRAYAIIGQGTISRIIEARPDELRVFLEEAAGVTKYKERRKETESRLSDTRDNLLRVEDIRIELTGQIERLEGQAAIARQYRDFHAEMSKKQHLLWLSRRQEAQGECARLAREIAQASTGLEAEIASLRATEAALEEIRVHYDAAHEHVNQAQSGLYAANMEVVRLESEIRHRRESRAEHESRLAQLTDDLAHWQAQGETFLVEEARWLELQEITAERVEHAELRLAAQQDSLPETEENYAATQQRVQAERRELAQLEQHTHVEQTHRSHAQRSLQILAGRRERLQQERNDLPVPDHSEVALKQEMLDELRLQIAECQDDLSARQHALNQLTENRRQAFNEVQQTQRAQAETTARRSALEQLQKRVLSEGTLGEWLRRHQLENRTPLWKRLHVESTWQDALEAVLRERIAALNVNAFNAHWEKDRPGSKLTLLLPKTESTTTPLAESLFAHVRCDDPTLTNVLAEWLGNVLTAPDLATALLRRDKLQSGQYFVTPQGDKVSAQSLTLFAPDTTEHGLLERQREIETLSEQLLVQEAAVDEAQAKLAAIEHALNDGQSDLETARHDLEHKQSEAHAIQVENLRLTQALDRFRERQEQLDANLADISLEEESENERLFAAEEAIATQQEAIVLRQETLREAIEALETIEHDLRSERDRVSHAQRELQEAQFSLRESQSKYQEVLRNGALAQQQIKRLEEEKLRCSEHAKAMHAEDLEQNLQDALTNRLQCEELLATTRDALESATQTQRTLQEQRMRCEQQLDPLREKISDLRLKEQAASLNVEQFSAQLQEANADEASLIGELHNVRPSTLQGAITALQKAIEALGAVNLAALDELEAASQRKSFLDAQADDLTQAMETLENAIRRIDRETRELLQSTFDAVNKNFGQLFPILFGGGEARLLMTGDEILDAGVQVMAQPPGKKNSTIHLLSGGEKALTATALVFSMFQLNPAPFCLLDEVDAPLDDTNTERFCSMVKQMSAQTQFLFISHNKIAMEMAQQLVGVTMQESGVSRIVEVSMEEALRLREQIM